MKSLTAECEANITSIKQVIVYTGISVTANEDLVAGHTTFGLSQLHVSEYVSGITA